AVTGLAHLVGAASPRRRRADSRPRRAGGLFVSEGRDAEISDIPDYVSRDRAIRQRDRYSAEHDRPDPGVPRVETAGAARKFSAAHAPSRKSDVDGSHLARWHYAYAELRRSLQLQLDEQLHLCRRHSSGFAEGHHHPRYRLARQHTLESE